MSKFLIFRISRLSPKGMITKKVIHFYATKKLLFQKTSFLDLLDKISSFSLFLLHVFKKTKTPNTKKALARLIAA